MSEPPKDPGTPSDVPSVAPSIAKPTSKYVDFALYATAAATYIPLSIYNKWLLDWIVGPFWLVAWVWGLPALVKLVRRQPIKPVRGPARDLE